MGRRTSALSRAAGLGLALALAAAPVLARAQSAERVLSEAIVRDGDDCAVQAVKPQQCRDFPNLWNFPGFEKVCHALPREVDDAEYARRIARIRLTGSAKT